MGKQKKSNYFIGLDIGTNSVGYATTTERYDLIKYRQHPMWGVHLFDEAELAQKRRAFRAARRRLDRRQQRIKLLRELFSKEVGAIDPKFFQRIDSSSIKKEANALPFAIFADKDYNDSNFYKKYPTIHHLIMDLMESEQHHDVRLIYIACAWLLAHRGHFFSDIDKEKIDEITSFSAIYEELEYIIEGHGTFFSWKHSEIDSETIGKILKSSISPKKKYEQLSEYLHTKKSKGKDIPNEQLWLNEEELLKLLCGLKGNATKLFPNADYSEVALTLDSDDEKIAGMLAELHEEDAELFIIMKKVFDWSILADIIGESKNISAAKVAVYEKHKSDLRKLKHIVKKYLPLHSYTELFRASGKNNYVAYCGKQKEKKVQQDEFYKFLKSLLKNISPENEDDSNILEQINQEIAAERFLPKQITSDNRTIPYQLYWSELNILLSKASVYLPFLNECDEDGLSVREKILSIMEFRIPYYVGPLNSHSNFSWLKRKAEGRILPWNFDEKVDRDASEKAFIDRMTNSCTFLPGEAVLPKHSLLYQRFEVLNLINAIHVNGCPISVTCKQEIYGVFNKHNKVSKKTILAFLKSNNYYQDIDLNCITGIDDTITASLSSQRIFQQFISAGKLTDEEVESIINQRAFTEDTKRFRLYLKKFTTLTDEDIQWISTRRFQGFGRLSKKFLTEPLFDHPETGSKLSIINMMWEYNLNLQQLMTESYPFAAMVSDARKEYYANTPASLSEQLDRMYVSNAVKRPIIRTLTIVDEVVKTMGYAPEKIFVEMARDVAGGNKGKRTVSRLAQLKNLYQKIADEDTRRLSLELEKYTASQLQKDTLYLYFMQLGKDMYTGEQITDLSLYNKEHIYPRSKVKDDSILNNLVLVRSEVNGEKKDIYPIDPEIRKKRATFWKYLRDNELISAEKYFRLTRSTPFSDAEEWGFINRQLVETRQSTKVVTELLKERYPDSEIVYVKAGLVSDFRHEFNKIKSKISNVPPRDTSKSNDDSGLVKSRTVNDLHHGKDAYLNIVVGNVYHGYFTRKWFMERSNDYSIKTETLFARPRVSVSGKLLWSGKDAIEKVETIMRRNYLHLSCYTYCKHGGFFNQNPVSAGEDLIPLKKEKSTAIYGGYNAPAVTFFVLILAEETKKNKCKKLLRLVPVDLLCGDSFLKDRMYAINYVKNSIDALGKRNWNITFPLGLKPIKIRTVFEVDHGLRFMLNSDAGGGELGISYCSPLLLDSAWEKYIKRLEAFSEKRKNNPEIIFSEHFDKIFSSENIKLYDVFIEKLQNGIFAKRRKNPLEILKKGREKFVLLQAPQQAEVLLAIINSFGRGCVNGVNLKLIDGNESSAKARISSNLVNWKKDYQSAYIIYSDASGLHETKSINLLDLI